MELLICICATFLHPFPCIEWAEVKTETTDGAGHLSCNVFEFSRGFLGLSEVSRAGTGGTGVLVEELVEELGPI